MKIRTAATIVAATAAFAPQPAQRPPRTEVYLASLSTSAPLHAGGPVVNISRSPGYDNQPSFTPDGSAVLFTSDRAGGETDIFRYDLAAATTTELTHDAENEYSPLVMPAGRTFSVVHGDEQSLWAYDLDGSHGRLLYQHKGKIGYHVWIDDTHLGIFVLGDENEPNTLQIAEPGTNAAVVVASSIGRSLLMRPKTGTMTFVDKTRPGHWLVKELNPKTRAITTLVETPEGSEDLAWDPMTGTLLTANGTRLLGWSPAQPAQGWRTIGDLASDGVTKITRLAVNPVASAAAAGRIAIVGEPRE
jgi:hypothetical protein